MTWLKQNWFKKTINIVCWMLFVWGVFIVVSVLNDGYVGAFKEWPFYVFGILPIFALIFIRGQAKKVLFQTWHMLPSKEWFSKNWFKLAGVVLVVFMVTQYFSYLDRKNTLDEEQLKREYVAKRKRDCLDIYKVESDKWNNVRGWNYNEPSDNLFSFNSDTCEVIYKDNKTGENFSKYY